MAGHVGSPRPRDVADYPEAAAAKRIPPRPEQPPSLLPGTTSHQALVRCGVVLAGAALLIVAVIVSGPESGGQMTVPQLAVMLGATAAGIAAMLMAIGPFRRARSPSSPQDTSRPRSTRAGSGWSIAPGRRSATTSSGGTGTACGS